jgi:hypothetical protein
MRLPRTPKAGWWNAAALRPSICFSDFGRRRVGLAVKKSA